MALAMPAVLAASALVATAVFAKHPRWCAVPLTVVVVSAFAIFLPRWPVRTDAPVDALRIAAVNLQFDSTDPAGGAADALAIDADILVVSELMPAVDLLIAPAYPYRLTSDEIGYTTTTGVYSRIPIERLPQPVVPGEMLRVAVGGSTPFTLYAVHLPAPALIDVSNGAQVSFADHPAVSRALITAVEAEPGPVVIAGDLNLSDRVDAYGDLVDGRLDAMRTGWAASTYSLSLAWRLLLLRIDHLVVPADWCVADAHSFHLAGSDHDGITAQVGVCD